MSVFEGIEDGKERRAAQAVLNSYRRSVSKWQREAEALPNYNRLNVDPVELWDYLGFDDFELAMFGSYDDFRDAVAARRELISERVEAQKSARRSRDSRVKHRSRGRPRDLKVGQYVYFAVAYNRGNGATFQGYVAEASSTWDPTHIEDWQ